MEELIIVIEIFTWLAKLILLPPLFPRWLIGVMFTWHMLKLFRNDSVS